eukprot:6180090-Pleurochrysis_carterae.AAC.1
MSMRCHIALWPVSPATVTFSREKSQARTHIAVIFTSCDSALPAGSSAAAPATPPHGTREPRGRWASLWRVSGAEASGNLPEAR